MEARPEPEADEVWIKQDRTPLSDYDNEVDNALNNGITTVAGNGQEGNNGTRVSQNGKGAVSYSKELLS